jgi:hypothetical protein
MYVIINHHQKQSLPLHFTVTITNVNLVVGFHYPKILQDKIIRLERSNINMLSEFVPVKKLTATRPFVEDKRKFCMTCDNAATMEILFDVNATNIILAERYCDKHCEELVKEFQ